MVEPTRRRIQLQVDRRFNRARYDAANTALAFSSRLRDTVDPDGVREDLVVTVRSTLQPDSIALWIRERTQDGQRPPAA